VTTHQPNIAALLEAALNLSRHHRDHEKYYASAPRETAVQLQRHARTLQALADRWSTIEPSTRHAVSPYEGADDLNSAAATQLDGVLFLEGEGRPAEISHLIAELRTRADESAATGEWLAKAMQSSWDMAGILLQVDGLADVLGERHRIITNDWLAAHMNSLIGLMLARAADMLDYVDFTPVALRRDLAGARVAPHRLYSTAELIARAADLCSDSAGLVHDNERRWRVTRDRIGQVVQAMSTSADQGPARATTPGTNVEQPDTARIPDTGTADAGVASDRQ
jgi:hypothetical protein